MYIIKRQILDNFLKMYLIEKFIDKIHQLL